MSKAEKAIDTFSEQHGYIAGSVHDSQSITAEWEFLQDVIDGVKLREVRNVIKKQGGVLTEVYRNDWALDGGEVGQVFQNLLNPGAISGWHVHQHTTDRIFVNLGAMKVVLYDARAGSATHKLVNEFVLGLTRPGMLLVPPGVWHAVQNVGTEVSGLLNIVDKAYAYEAPDHWRLPADTDKIPYSFG